MQQLIHRGIVKLTIRFVDGQLRCMNDRSSLERGRTKLAED